MLTFLLSESVQAAVLVLLILVAVVGCVGPRRYRALRQPTPIKIMSLAVWSLGAAVFVLGLIGLIERASVTQWLPLLIAGLLSDLVCTTIKRTSNAAHRP